MFCCEFCCQLDGEDGFDVGEVDIGEYGLVFFVCGEQLSCCREENFLCLVMGLIEVFFICFVLQKRICGEECVELFVVFIGVCWYFGVEW